MTDILTKIRKIIRSINLESKKIQKDYGVSIPQVLCLSFLNDSPNYQSNHKQIRDFLNLNSSTVSGIIDRLEKKGLVARLPKTGDKRVINVALTASGARLLANIPSLLHEQFAEKLKDLPEAKLRQVEDSLDLIISMLDIRELKAPPVITVDLNSDDQIE